jgi:hypothetical protein
MPLRMRRRNCRGGFRKSLHRSRATRSTSSETGSGSPGSHFSAGSPPDQGWHRPGPSVPPARSCPSEHHARHLCARVRSCARPRRRQGFDRRRVRGESNLTKSDQIAKSRGLGAIRALSCVRQTACSSRLRGWSVPGSNRRPPACKFSSERVWVDRQPSQVSREAKPEECGRSAWIALRQRDLTQI